ncbi:pentatricopeptide repeat-containing protein [Cucumis melo var. makuwa]|uniref:Pentatricopeptide repeat-containing protein n=1 Tax=Cucumis melo var. makuwa TaxID=1194695 RepID=A0A5D3E3V9_CUCMM|nr:pentatricopeptide repeat-containing protein [Cucumis melo var. makuwa]TYK30584.1 pentatricopeptide repeat-containing protein [Cucumis melo var. makuwa]
MKLLRHCRTIRSVQKLLVLILVEGLDQNRFIATKLIGKYVEHDEGDSKRVCKFGSVLEALNPFDEIQDVEIARKVFADVPLRDIVNWNSMIVGYTLNEKEDDAIMLFHAMLYNQANCSPDYATLVAILHACVTKSASQVSFWVHSYIILPYFYVMVTVVM